MLAPSLNTNAQNCTGRLAPHTHKSTRARHNTLKMSPFIIGLESSRAQHITCRRAYVAHITPYHTLRLASPHTIHTQACVAPHDTHSGLCRPTRHTLRLVSPHTTHTQASVAPHNTHSQACIAPRTHITLRKGKVGAGGAP